jgi:exonuclease III
MKSQGLSKKKKNELKILIAEHFPDFTCLQKTNFNNQTYITLRNYTSYAKNRTNGLRASGGVAIYIKTFFPSKQIHLKTHLEAIPISVQLNETHLNTCNLYLPNQTKIELSDIENITKQLPKLFIILGDFNAHCII